MTLKRVADFQFLPVFFLAVRAGGITSKLLSVGLETKTPSLFIVNRL